MKCAEAMLVPTRISRQTSSTLAKLSPANWNVGNKKLRSPFCAYKYTIFAASALPTENENRKTEACVSLLLLVICVGRATPK